MRNEIEKNVAKVFDAIFADYSVHKPVNTSQGGWPDRIIQLSHSRAVAVELKLVSLQKRTGKIKLSGFRPEQAAWFAKWQRSGGLGFLFLGVNDFCGEYFGYGIITCLNWRDWLGSHIAS